MTLLAVDSLSKTFSGSSVRGGRTGVEAVVDLTFRVDAGEFLTIIGPSGCGKSTLLRLLAGLEQPDTGQIDLQGQPLPGASDRQGRFGYMPQRDTLLPLAYSARKRDPGSRAVRRQSRRGPRRSAAASSSFWAGGLRELLAERAVGRDETARGLAANFPRRL